MRRRLNWGKNESTLTAGLETSDLLAQFDNRIKSLKNKVGYRDRVIAQMHTEISNGEAVILEQKTKITTQEERIKEL